MNPFNYANIVKDEHFYNRETEQKHLTDVVSGGNNIVLYAPRRYGKSSLIAKTLDELKQEGFGVIYLDLMTIISIDQFIQVYSNKIFQSLKNPTKKIIKKFAEYIRGIYPSLNVDKFGNFSLALQIVEGSEKISTLTDTIDLPEKFANDKKRWIVAFDEFQEISSFSGLNLENILRSCIQHHQNVSYIFSGSRTHLLKNMFNNKKRPFYNSASLMKLGKIDTKKSIKYLTDRFKKSGFHISKENAEHLIQKAGNIPYYIQFLAAEIWQDLINNNKAINEDMINNAVDKILQMKSDYYWEILNQNTNTQKKVFTALANDEKDLYSGNVIRKYDIQSPATVQISVKKFIEKGWIEKYNNKIEFADPFLKLFINKIL